MKWPNGNPSTVQRGEMVASGEHAGNIQYTVPVIPSNLGISKMALLCGNVCMPCLTDPRPPAGYQDIAFVWAASHAYSHLVSRMVKSLGYPHELPFDHHTFVGIGI